MSHGRIVIVGAGAAGLTAAIRAAESGARVTLLNAHPKVGLKILMSGGTRCNVTHREVSERDFNAGSRPFVARVLRAFTPEQTRAWMESLGVGLKLEETGKYFPVTDDAETVLEALLQARARAGATLESGARVVRLVCEDKGFRAGIQTVHDSVAFDPGAVHRQGEQRWPLPEVEPDRWIEADAVVIATGGLSFPRTGSDGVGYALVRSLGHTLEPPVPALTPLTSGDPLCRALQGLTLEAELTLSVGGKRAAKARGSLLVTHFGYSGPTALDLSRHWHRAGEEEERAVTASFAPGETGERLDREWIEAGTREPRRSVRRVLAQRLPERLAERLCAEVTVEPGQAMSQLDRTLRRALVDRVAARDLEVSGTLGYEKAEVTAGGVRLDEVNPSTLESRITPGLYLCGEILDVDGRLGGFNFQWAWSSGTVAGRAAVNRLCWPV